jgi:hypothetical protein
VRHIVMFSGGAGSWAAAKRVVAQHGAQDVTLLFTDTRKEDQELYELLDTYAANVGAPLIRIADGRAPWHVFFDERFLGNSQKAPCSRILKRELANRWLAENCDPADTMVYSGIDWSEKHRHEAQRDIRKEDGWTYLAPMCDPPLMLKDDMLLWMQREGLTVPKMYRDGFAHFNCGGECVRAGQGHWANLLRVHPKRFAYNERMELAFNVYVGRDVTTDPVSILKEQVDGVDRPLLLRDLRIRVESGKQVDMFEIGGCGCFVDDAA